MPNHRHDHLAYDPADQPTPRAWDYPLGQPPPMPEGDLDPAICAHPADAILWNPWNEVVQCHRCGTVMPDDPDHPALRAEEAFFWRALPDSPVPGAALVRRGWRVTYDDKLWLATDGPLMTFDLGGGYAGASQRYQMTPSLDQAARFNSRDEACLAVALWQNQRHDPEIAY